MNDSKPLLKSRTLWFNLAAAALAVLIDNTGLLREILPGGGYVLLMVLTSMGNVYLRLLTTTAVTLK
jgi:hypothetical protein